MTLLVALLIHHGATQMTLLGRSVERCDVMCATAFANSKASLLVVFLGIHHIYDLYVSKYERWVELKMLIPLDRGF